MFTVLRRYRLVLNAKNKEKKQQTRQKIIYYHISKKTRASAVLNYRIIVKEKKITQPRYCTVINVQFLSKSSEYRPLPGDDVLYSTVFSTVVLN